jgi:hypothetical protein
VAREVGAQRRRYPWPRGFPKAIARSQGPAAATRRFSLAAIILEGNSQVGFPDDMESMTTKQRIFTMSFASVYPLYVAKAGKKGRKKSEVDAVICWLTGYSQRELEGQLKKQTDFETFFKEAPKLNPARTLIKGVVCGVRVEDIQDPTMREIRYLDKLVDELAKGKAMDKILRA